MERDALSKNKKQFILMIFSLTLVVLLSVFGVSNIEGQSSANSMADVLLQLKEENINSRSNQGTIQFVNPITPNVSEISLGSLQDGSITILAGISEVGLDYFCIDSVGGGVMYKECFPYSNVASINYPER